MFRHYFTAQAFNNPNTSDIQVMHWLGHKNLSMTANYTRDTKDSSEELYEKVRHNFQVIDGTKEAK